MISRVCFFSRKFRKIQTASLNRKAITQNRNHGDRKCRDQIPRNYQERKRRLGNTPCVQKSCEICRMLLRKKHGAPHSCFCGPQPQKNVFAGVHTPRRAREENAKERFCRSTYAKAGERAAKHAVRMGKRKGIRKKKQKRINKEKVLSYVRLLNPS
jgi:hypothetical protein